MALRVWMATKWRQHLRYSGTCVVILRLVSRLEHALHQRYDHRMLISPLFIEYTIDNDLKSIVTITGTPTQVYVNSCAAYMHWCWESTSYDLLAALETAIRSGVYGIGSY